ncbi:MFS transporter [Noviherbaspirillum pedocola]|uniref:MFS transporter n=1 Tax=Noviherbaspirillum pedocola TaxID=2801341 RepID=A0A934SYR4_9BURK|nr:MFS transporter [Noviherbaspirillum pedocola]MBK4735392.1 MFS transporter [Noviherbaspirillum pedocola]
MSPLSTAADAGKLLSPIRLFLFALAAGVLVANLYYVQPLTALLAASFHIRLSWAGYLVTTTQIGYVLGVFLLVPLSDVLDRRSLLSLMLGANIASLMLAALSPNFVVFAFSGLLIGMSSSAVMVITSMVASHAPDQSRGRMVGTVMTGLLLGILLARTVAGAVAGLSGGWRPMYVIAALAVSILLVALRQILPAEAPRGTLQYGKLLHSLADIVRAEPLLRQRALFSALGLGTFSVFWTGLTFLLSGAPYHYGEAQIGLFGLVGAAGALAANTVGRLTDRGHGNAATWGLALLTLASWVFIGFGAHTLVALLAGVLLLDIGVMGLQVAHQSVIYQLAPQARARITTVFIGSGFVGAAAGSGIASASFAAGGWFGLTIAGATMPLAILLLWAGYRLRKVGRPKHLEQACHLR